MDCNSRSSCRFQCLCHFGSVYALTVPAAAYLHRDRCLPCRLNCGFRDIRRKPDVLHQSRACSRTHYLWHRTAHIYVDDIGAVLQNYLHSLRHKVGLAAEKLDSHGTLIVRDRTKLRSLAVAVADALCGNHFADNISRTVLLAHEPVRSVRNSCHGSKRSRPRHSHASYFNCFSHCAAPQYCFPYF